MNNKQTNIPQGYKQSSLGMIPQEWEVKRLGEIGNFYKGYGVPKDKITKEGLPCLTYGDIYTKYGIVIKNISQFIDSDTAEISKLITKGDILFTGSGETLNEIGKNTVFVDDFPMYAGGDIVIFRPNYQLNSITLSYILNTDWSNKQKFRMGQGHSVVHIYSKNLEQLIVALPPLPEQEKIAEVLSVWDEAIERQTKLTALLEKRKQALMQRLLKPKTHWEKVKAGNIFKNRSIKGTENEILLSSTQEYGIIPRDMLESRVTMPAGETNGFKLVEVGNFVISLRSFQGGIEYSNYRGVVSPAYTVLSSKIDINNSFYRYYFKSTEFISRLAVAVIGIRDGKQISYNDFCFIKIPNPPLPEQTAIAEVLSTADSEIALARKKLESLRTQKKGLMQQLLTGKKRVKI